MLLPHLSLSRFGLERLDFLPWNIDGLDLVLPLLEYDARQFHASAFETARLTLAAHIERSVPKRQAEYFFGRIAARLALEPHGLGCMPVTTGPNREPVWPAGIVGSITHTSSWCAAAALPSNRFRGIGIDIEAPLSGDAQASVIATALSPAELDVLAATRHGIPEASQLALAFSAKESFYKAAYPAVGRFFGFEAMQILSIDPAHGHIDFAVTEALCDGLAAGTRGRAYFRLLDGGAVLTAFVW